MAFFVAFAVGRIKVAVNNYFGKSHQLCYRMADDSIASHAEVLKGSSCVPATGIHDEPLRTPSAWEANRDFKIQRHDGHENVA